jgi:hypothetical protein
MVEIRLSQNQVEGITYIEQVYLLRGEIPTDASISDVLGVAESTVKKWWQNESFQTVLRNKAIPIEEKLGLKKREILSPEQLAVANMVLNLQDKRSLREKLETASVSPQKYQAWRRDPIFMGYIKQRAEAMFTDGYDIAYMNVLKNMEGGDLNASKFFFEMTGVYNPKVTVDLNVDSVMVRVIEIIQRHVKDPDTIEAIAWEIEELGGGKRPEAQVIIPRELPPVVEVQEVTEKSQPEPARSPVFTL